MPEGEVKNKNKKNYNFLKNRKRDSSGVGLAYHHKPINREKP